MRDISFYKSNMCHADIWPWIDKETGEIMQPMLESQLSVLKSKMIGKFGEGINCMSIN